jgi:RNA polymerase sigma-70 factor (ECF subfamily)
MTTTAPAAALRPLPFPSRPARAARRGDAGTPRAAGAPHVLDAASLTAHLDRLYRAALSLCGSPTDAEDLVQEVCVRALLKPRMVHGADDLPYLLRMLRNVFYNHHRAQASRRTTPVEPETLATIPDGGRHDPERRAVMADVHRTIAALPDHFRDVLVAVDVAGLPYADAAAALDIPVGTVMSRLHRARAAVARRLGPVAAAA